MLRIPLRVGLLTCRVASRWAGAGLTVAALLAAAPTAATGQESIPIRPALAPIQRVRVQPPAASAAQPGSVARSARDPGLEAVHKALLKSIRDFQDKWRKAWRSVELTRHDPIDLNEIRGWVVQRNGIIEGNVTQGDRDALNWTPDLRRYEAMLCYIGSPSDRGIEAVKAKATYEMGPPKTKAAIAAARSGEDSRTTDRRIANAQIGGGPSNQTFITTHVIRPAPGVGAVCPLWSPPDSPLQLDEGEAIDLALPPNGRDGVRKARETLLLRLDAAQAQWPNDDWITGQRVRFVFDQRSPARTLATAHACAASMELCAGLRGLAEEQAGHIAAAEAEFRSVDATMSGATDPHANSLSVGANEDCIDKETLLLLRESDRPKMAGGSCAAQRQRVRRMWWLADPLWSVNGNERYVAHQSRRLSASLRAIDDRDERYIWARQGGGDAMRELVVRYGWPGYTYWPGTQFEDEINEYIENATTRTVHLPHTAVEYSSDRTALVPAINAILDPFSLNASHWDLNVPVGTLPDAWWPPEHMMLFPKLAPLPTGQEAHWRRDSTIVFQLAVDDPLTSLDTAVRGASLAALVTGTSDADTRVVANAAIGAGNTLRLRAMLPPTPLVLSAEVLPRSLQEHALRLRYGFRPPPSLRDMRDDDVALSEPLFLRLPNQEQPAPTDVPGVLQSMAGSLTFPRAEPLAVYWESYGFLPGDSVRVRLRVRRNDDANALRRFGAALGLASALRDSLAIGWTEPDARRGTLVQEGRVPVVGRSVALDMHALPAGNYVVVIEMQRGATIARSERMFTLRDP